MKKYHTLTNQMTRILVGFILAVLLMGAINLLAGTGGYTQLNAVYSLFTAYNAYDKAANDLHDAVMDFFTGASQESQEDIFATADVLDGLGREMNDLSSHAQFEDTFQLTSAYSDRARKFANDLDGMSEDRLEAVQTLVHMHELVLLQYDTLNQYMTMDIDNNIRNNARIWRAQLLATLALFALMLVYTVWSSLHLSKHVVRPITELTQDIHRLKDGEHDTPGRGSIYFESNYQELHILRDTYYDMTDTISTQIEALKDKIALSEALREKQLALSNAELGLMQSLINPHFLYNCLSTLSSLAMIEQAPRTRKSAVMIASFLRASLNNIGKQATIQEELNYTQRYIEIQKLRFSDFISFSVCCDPACAGTKVPAVLLQPLVENAIQHGLKSLASGAKIDIRVEKREHTVQMCVIDNGIGIAPETLAQIDQMLHADFSPDQKGVGLRSVAYRLRSIYSDAASVSIESRHGYTEVRLIVPIGTA